MIFLKITFISDVLFLLSIILRKKSGRAFGSVQRTAASKCCVLFVVAAKEPCSTGAGSRSAFVAKEKFTENFGAGVSVRASKRSGSFS
jgi:hypothetical protein